MSKTKDEKFELNFESFWTQTEEKGNHFSYLWAGWQETDQILNSSNVELMWWQEFNPYYYYKAA